jgi:hypothetical protein
MKKNGKARGKAARLCRGAALAALAGAGLYYGPIFYGIMDYLYQPECFRAGKKPRPSRDAAPGGAVVVPLRVNAGDAGLEVALRFTAGPGGISEDGGIKVGLCRVIRFPDGGRRLSFVLPYGWGILQNTHPSRPGYVRVELRSSGRAHLEVERKPAVPLRFALRIAGREWLRRRGASLEPLDYTYLALEQSKIKVRVRGGRLEEGDEVVFHLGDKSLGGSGWKAPHHPIFTDFLVEVDEKAMGRYRPIEELPRLEVMGGPAQCLELNISSPEGDSFRGVLRGSDASGHSDRGIDAEAVIVGPDGDEAGRAALKPGTGGAHVSGLRADSRPPGKPFRFSVRTVGGLRLEGHSNPVASPGPDDMRLFWGDIHAHTALCDGTLGPEEFYLQARDEMGLDFAALSCHDDLGRFEPTGRTEEEIALFRDLVKRFDQDGEFAAFLGYEWTHHALGHRNVYFSPDETEPVFPSSDDPRSDTLEKLFSMLEGKRCMVIPHHPGWRRMFYLPFNLLKFARPDLPPAYTWGECGEMQRLAEIYSSHGDSEGYHGPYPITHGKRGFPWPSCLWDDRGEPGLGSYLAEAWASGLRLGVIAGSDRHDHGVSERVSPIMVYPYGLAAVWARSLTSRDIWEALWERRTYGTTGARIYLRFSAGGYPMGSECPLPGEARLSLQVAGTAPLQMVEVVKYDLRGYRSLLRLRSGLELDGGRLSVEEIVADGDLVGDTLYYLRASQADGHWAWSSPIWMDAG